MTESDRREPWKSHRLVRGRTQETKSHESERFRSGGVDRDIKKSSSKDLPVEQATSNLSPCCKFLYCV